MPPRKRPAEQQGAAGENAKRAKTSTDAELIDAEQAFVLKIERWCVGLWRTCVRSTRLTPHWLAGWLVGWGFASSQQVVIDLPHLRESYHASA